MKTQRQLACLVAAQVQSHEDSIEWGRRRAKKLLGIDTATTQQEAPASEAPSLLPDDAPLLRGRATR